jgi:hypothetical protein
MTIGNGGLIVIGENFNVTRKIRMNSPKVVDEDGKVGIGYVDLDGIRRSSTAPTSSPMTRRNGTDS